MTDNYHFYYHAGVLGAPGDPDSMVWSPEIHTTRAAAEAEALRMAVAGRTPIVECWRQKHGRAPRFDAVEDAWQVPR